MVGRLAAVAIGGQLAFIASWLVAQTLEPGYDVEGEQVSALAAGTADNPWILTLGIVAWATGTAVCGEALRRALPRRRLRWAAVAALWVAAAGLNLLAVGFSPFACGWPCGPAAAHASPWPAGSSASRCSGSSRTRWTWTRATAAAASASSC